MPAVAVNFILHAAAAGIEPTTLFAYDGLYAQELRNLNVPVITLGRRTPLFWRTKRFLMNWFLLVRGKHYDIIHIHSVKLALSVLIAHWLGARVVFHVHELPRRIGWLLRKAIAIADAVVFCSATCATHFAGLPAKRRQTIVNAMHFHNQPPVRHEAAGRKIVMMGSINKNKGQDILLKSFVCLKSTLAELWLYGTTGLSAHKYVRDLKLFARRHGVADRVFFPGPTDDAIGIFSESSVVVHTSLSESFGMALVEAMSCGVPVIAHDLEGMREVIVDGVTGFLVTPGDIGTLTAKIDELLASPELRTRMGRAGYESVRERFDIASRLNEYIQLYEGLGFR